MGATSASNHAGGAPINAPPAMPPIHSLAGNNLEAADVSKAAGSSTCSDVRLEASVGSNRSMLRDKSGVRRSIGVEEVSP